MTGSAATGTLLALEYNTAGEHVHRLKPSLSHQGYVLPQKAELAQNPFLILLGS
jgi:hypothetical protein